jgi:outer membrane protein assembly factor BamB
LWSFEGLKGPVTSKPVLKDSILVFGAWDTNLYAVNTNSHQLMWKWNNGSSIVNYSPAACIPVIKNNAVFIAAPDRYLSAIDLLTGATLWRSNEAAVRESIGLSENGELVYGKTMQDTVVVFAAQREPSKAIMKMHVGYGYEHAPSMLTEKNGLLFFGTRNGIVYALDMKKNTVAWAYKIDNSMVNTVAVTPDMKVLAATMDGRIVLLQILPSGVRGQPAKGSGQQQLR